MNLFRTLNAALVLALAGGGLSSCLSPPDYPTTPQIELKALRKIHVRMPAGQANVDTLVFEVKILDGDGDLGLSLSDTQSPPFNQIPNGPRNRNGFNFFLQPYLKDSNGAFQPFFSSPPGGQPGQPGEYDGIFPRLSPSDDKPAPLRVDPLVYKLPITLDGGQLDGSFRAGQEFRFEISIMDRALHESNKITTPGIVLGPN